MNRRNLLKGTGAIFLYSNFPVILSEFLSSCKNTEKKLLAVFFTDEEFNMISQLIEAMLPKTSTPGAIEAHVPYFIDFTVKNCMNNADQQLIKKGLKQMIDETEGKFTSLPPEEKLNVLKKTDEAAFKDDKDKAWFRIIKKLSLIGYFTSKEGMTSALNYVKVPGEYKACIPYSKGEKALAKTFLMYW